MTQNETNALKIAGALALGFGGAVLVHRWLNKTVWKDDIARERAMGGLGESEERNEEFRSDIEKMLHAGGRPGGHRPGLRQAQARR